MTRPLCTVAWLALLLELGCAGVPRRGVPDIDPKVRSLVVMVEPRATVMGPEAPAAGAMPERIRAALIASLKANQFRLAERADTPDALVLALTFDVRGCCGGGSYNGFEAIATLTASANGVPIDRVQYDSRDSAGAGAAPFPGEAMNPDSWGYWLVAGLTRSTKLLAFASAAPTERSPRARPAPDGEPPGSPATALAVAPPPAPVPAPAQPPANVPAPAPSPTAAPAEHLAFRAGPQPTWYALVIGIERYRDLPAATGASRDAEEFSRIAHRALGVPERNIKLLLGEHATKGDIESALRWIATNVPAGGRIFFFFAGHGTPDPSEGSPFLLPYDGNPQGIRDTALPLSTVLAKLGRSRAKDVLALVDSCFSGSGGRSVLPRGARPLVAVREARPVPRVALLSAASGSQISGPAADGRGLFSRYLNEGLGSGKADLDGDGQVTLAELHRWLTPRVLREAQRDSRKQEPALILGKGTSAAEFVVTSGTN